MRAPRFRCHLSRGRGFSVSLMLGSGAHRNASPAKDERPRIAPPLSPEPESFHRPRRAGLPLRWDRLATARFPECPVRAVLLPERFRGGCSFGGGGSPPRSPARP